VNQIATLVLATLALFTPAPQPTPLTAEAILRQSEDAWIGLRTYEVPVTISGSVRVAIISVPVKMTGTQYYQAPDAQALHLHNPPSFARGLGNTLSTMGTPQTWLRDYNIALPAAEQRGNHTAYVLIGTPKRSDSRVKTMKMSVSAATWAIEDIVFSYTNGATLEVNFTHDKGTTQYHLARTVTVAAKFPSYKGRATITYGEYVLNQPIAATVFTQH
jgi:hypothetical protein